ncbi:MAG TPA: M20/M25/M40 family metallo-hydrolase [Polyangiaceae bacterium]|nr:M20/M25/M40 family metallo-hydrolase [Polyangiaceae bacterium]
MNGADIDWAEQGASCRALLCDLIRIPTVNPPGNERPAAELVAEFLRASRLEPTVLGPSRERASVVARYAGAGDLPPLLLTGHLDVVEADASDWQHPPFSADRAGGFIWGRGAIDMKNMVSMSACVMGMLARTKVRLARDVIFAAVADEETGSSAGAHFLVSEHPELVRAEYALGEIGGFSMHLMGKVFYPIQVAEKGQVWLKATFQGESGHGSMPRTDSAVVRAAEAIVRLGRARLPFHRAEVVDLFLRELSAALPYPARIVLPRLTSPILGGLLLDRALRDPSLRRTFSTYLSNTASPTVVRAGNKTNVIPGAASFEIDGRTLPGQSDEDFLREVRRHVGEEAAIEVLATQPPVVTPVDTPMYRCLADVIRAHDPVGIPIPMIIPGFTDAKAWSRLGTKYYGFSPVRFAAEDGISFSALYHGKDERIPEAGLAWGLATLYDAVVRFAGASR